ncbi:hypothetical protein SSX86_006966 [Deinandra increscens subsp. villosa]|uniref:F-box domain-containing protein n=1 Tax=Deinandra increscens subsp. villosa TaxID=3103831 RepID=A0AAP0H4A7_9ASTR
MSSMNEDDKLSRLPEDISSHILSLMPTKYAVRTSILSKRWRYTWMLVTNLDIDDLHPYHDTKVLSKFVHRVMESCKSSQIQLFRLNLYNKYVKRSSVSRWINKAVRLNVCEVEIQYGPFELPLRLCTCKTLTKLTIDNGNLEYAILECPYPVNLPCVKTLEIFLRRNPFVNAFKLISGCPILERLSLEIMWCQGEEDYVFHIPTLKRLELRLVRCTSFINKIVLNLPNLEYLFVGDELESLFVMEDLSSLVEASISLYRITNDHLFVELLKAIKGVESLSIENPKGITDSGSLSDEDVLLGVALPIFQRMKHMEFKGVWRPRLILQLLESCPNLKHLYIEAVLELFWIEAKIVPSCMLTNLTTIKYSSFNGRENEIHFLEYMKQRSLAMSSMNEDDRLSRLPDDISSHILSLMPTKYAVRTSILSKRWRYSWMFVTNLDFDDIHPYHSKNVLLEFVDRVMECCKSSQIHSFRLNFSNEYVKRSSVSSWIDKAVRLNACEVDIQVRRFELPLSLFTCKTLTKLRIDHQNPADAVWECSCPVNLPCLKTLDIAVRTNPLMNAFKIISGSPVLESLSLEVTFCPDEEDYIFNIPTLKRLKLRLVQCSAAINKNLEYLFVGGKLGPRFVMKDLSSLVEASISFHSITYDHLFVELLYAIKGVESLSIEGVLFTPPVLQNTKRLEFKGVWNCPCPGVILQFLESCPELKYLCIEMLEYFEWTEPGLVPTCMLTNLTTIKLSTFNGREDEIRFLEYMLENAEALKTVSITCENIRIEDAEKRLSKIQRASRDCEIYFIGK